jgi:hypothetical protein
MPDVLKIIERSPVVATGMKDQCKKKREGF